MDTRSALLLISTLKWQRKSSPRIPSNPSSGGSARHITRRLCTAIPSTETRGRTMGSLEEKGGDLYIVDEEVMLRVVGAGEMELGVEREYSGVVRFDTGRNDYYLDTGGVP